MSLLDHYWKLASDDPTERVDAAEALIKGLVEKDSQDDWDYALNRLINGLSSSRGSARLGFSMALAEILNTRKDKISIENYLEKAQKAFQITGSMKGQEERGLLFGKLFSFQTLASSPLWEACEISHFKKFTDLLVELALKKQWLREPAMFTLCEMLRGIDNMPFAREDALRFVFELMKERNIDQTCDAIAVYLCGTRDERRNYNSSSKWQLGDPLAKGNLTDLARTLKDLPVGNKENQKNNWKPTLHFVWQKLLAEILHENSASNDSSKKRQKLKNGQRKGKEGKDPQDTQIKLPEFWKACVDETFFANQASPERKMWGFELFVLAAQLEVPKVKHIVGANFLRTLNNQLAESDRLLNKMAKRCVATVLEVSKGNSARAAEYAEVILKTNKYFDRTSKSRLVQELLGLVGSHVRKIVELYLEEFASSDVKSRRWAADQLVQLVKSAKMAEIDGSSEWIDALQTIFKAFVPPAYFDVDSSGEKDSMNSFMQQRITSILSATMSRHVKPEGSWPYFVLQHVLHLQKQGKEPLVQLEGEILRAKSKAEQTVYRIHQKRISSPHVDNAQLQAFELIFSMVVLQIYASNTEAVTIVEELLLVYAKVAGQEDSLDLVMDDGELNEADASQVLTEILISFLSQQSSMLRKLSEEVWACFSEQISSQSLQLLFEVLGAKEGLAGQAELFDVEDDEDEDDFEDEAAIAADNRARGVDLHDTDDSDDGDSESEDEKSEGESGKESEDEAESDLDSDAKTIDEKRLAQTLGVEDEVDDEESMDDEQMSALDTQLAVIFRERKAKVSRDREKRKAGAKAKQNITLLKARMLDLLDIYIQKQPNNMQCLQVAVPLLELVRTTKDKRLAEKARDLLKLKLCRKTGFVLEETDDVAVATLLLQTVLEQAAVSSNNMHLLVCNQVAVFVSKLMIQFNEELVEVVLEIYSKAAVSWFKEKKNRANANTFIDIINFLQTKRLK